MQKTLQKPEETFYRIPCSRCDPRVQWSETSRIPLEKNKFTLSFSETSRPSIVVNFRTLFMPLAKAKFTHLFKKRVLYKTQRSFVFWSHMSFTRNIYFKNIRRTLPTGIKPGPREQPYKRFAHRYTHGKAWATLDQQIQIIQNFLRWQRRFPDKTIYWWARAGFSD